MHVSRRATSSLIRESGQVVVFFALLLPVFFGLGAIVLDIGNWYVHKRHLQTQVDAAVLAAAPSFSGCFHNQPVANAAVAGTALEYAGDTARDADTTNLQVQEPNDVRVTLNSQRYWRAGDSDTPTANGYGTPLEPVGDNSAGYPCTTSTLDAKATDFDVPKLFSWLPLFPDIKTHAKVEIHRVRAESGLLPLAVPEIDPNYVYAIFVDYAKDGSQVPYKVQELENSSTYGGGLSFLYSAWVTKPNSKVANNEPVTVHPDSINSDGTGVVILVSKSDTAPSKGGTLTDICTQPPSTLVACYAGTGNNFDGAATGQGLNFIHSYATSNGTPAAPLLRDVNLGAMVCTGGVSVTNLSFPYFINDDHDCTVEVTAKVDFGTETTPPNGDPRTKPNQGGFCAQVGPLDWDSTSGTISTWKGTLSVPVADGPQVLSLSYFDKTAGTNCNNSGANQGSFGPSAMSYSADDPAGPVGYVKLGAGPTTTCSGGTAQVDANSVPRGTHCYSVAVGLDRPLALKPWNSPNLVLRFASKAARKDGSGTANLNGSLLCDHGRTLAETFSTGCYTTYGLNFDRWGTPTCSSTTAICWKDVLCSAYPPNSLPPLKTVNNPPPICVAAKNGQVQAFQSGVYNRFEDPANGHGGCTPNYWPKTQALADTFFLPVDEGGHDFTNDGRYITLIVTDNTAFNSSNTAEPVKYFAGFYVTGWDTDNGNGKPKGCYNFAPSPNTCGAPNNDAHPILGCLQGDITKEDNGDLWGHFVRFVEFWLSPPQARTSAR